MKKQAKAGEVKIINLPGGAEMRFRWCPAGTFMMGSHKSEKGRNDDETEHRVTLTKGFWMGETEVTQKQWESVMGNNPAQFKGVDRPVEQVSWDDCQQFCERVSEELKCGMRLPTEAEWEYACRAGTTEAGTTSKYNNGTDSEDNMKQLGRYWDNGGSNSSESCSTQNGTATVGSYLPNAWGLYDMHGNVWEWCLDRYGALVYGTDPKGSSSGANRVRRGGSCGNVAVFGTSSHRLDSGPSTEDKYGGFRLVRTLEE